MKDIGKKLMNIARWYSMPADHFNTIKEAVELLEQKQKNSSYNSIKTELNGDAISRQVATDEIRKCRFVVDAIEKIKDLPSVTPQPKMGHWIMQRTFPTKLYDEYLNEYECSECQRGIRCTESQLVNYPYCHCGAKMQEEENG